MNTVNATGRPVPTSEASIAPDGPASAFRRLVGVASKWDFLLFVLVNGALFVRPMDMFPSLKGWPIYEVLICTSLIISFPAVLEQLTPRSLLERPITVCVLGLLATVILSHLWRLSIPAASRGGLEFAKLVVYYLLLVGVVNTPLRLRRFLTCLAVFACVHLGMAVIQHYGFIDLPAMRPVEEQAMAMAKGEVITRYRLCGAGIFHDTNDLSVLAAMAIPLCLYLMTDGRGGRSTGRWARSLLWLAAMGLCMHALMLTQSRGGMIAMVMGLVVFLFVRFGWKCILLVLVYPLLPLVFDGRQIDPRMLGRTTAQQRLAYWDEGLSLFSGSPVFGIGQGNFVRSLGNVAHNSFVHSFTELGFIGGMFFLGAFFLAFWPIYRLRFDNTDAAPDRVELRRLRPYFLAMVAAWATGMFSLSRSYVTPTYMIPGLATIYFGLATQGTSLPRVRVSGRLALRLVGLSLAFLVAIYVLVNVLRKG